MMHPSNLATVQWQATHVYPSFAMALLCHPDFLLLIQLSANLCTRQLVHPLYLPAPLKGADVFSYSYLWQADGCSLKPHPKGNLAFPTPAPKLPMLPCTKAHRRPNTPSVHMPRPLAWCYVGIHKCRPVNLILHTVIATSSLGYHATSAPESPMCAQLVL